ncbi:hypothetical protein ACFX13_044007 [Malus domestica]
MAKAKLLFACVFLLALVLSSGIISTEARSMNTADPSNSNSEFIEPKNPSISKPSYTVVAVKEANAFRPTTPGHSPGVGHGSPPVGC